MVLLQTEFLKKGIRNFPKHFKFIAIRVATSCLLSFLILATYLALQHGIDKTFASFKNHSIDIEIAKLPKKESKVLGSNSKPSKITTNNYNFRARVFDQYFKANGSPLYGQGQIFVDACQKYNAPTDCSLLPAIARVETNLCKTDISASQYNCWGYGGSGANRIIYNNFNQSIDDITRRLMTGYGAKFFNDPETGELTYCGAHCDTWGDKVKKVQDDLRSYALSFGYDL